MVARALMRLDRTHPPRMIKESSKDDRQAEGG
jgi:hypothetical protein